MAPPDSKMLVVLVWKRVTFRFKEITLDIFAVREILIYRLFIITSVIGNIELFVTANGGTLSDSENPFIFC